MVSLGSAGGQWQVSEIAVIRYPGTPCCLVPLSVLLVGQVNEHRQSQYRVDGHFIVGWLPSGISSALMDLVHLSGLLQLRSSSWCAAW